MPRVSGSLRPEIASQSIQAITAPSYTHSTMQTVMMSSALQTPVCRPSRSASITSRPAVARPMRSSVVVRAEKGGPPPTVRHLMTRGPYRSASRDGLYLMIPTFHRTSDAHRLAYPLADVGAFAGGPPVNGDPFIGMFETPVTSSPLVAGFLSNLPAYRTQVSPLLRGTEIGLAHGFLVVRPISGLLHRPLQSVNIYKWFLWPVSQSMTLQYHQWHADFAPCDEFLRPATQ